MLLKRKYISQNQTEDQREREQGERATTRAGLQEIEPWQDYLRRKQALKSRLRRNYVQLTLFTILFGVLTIGLRLELRRGQLTALEWGSRWLERQARHLRVFWKLDREDFVKSRWDSLVGQSFSDTQLRSQVAQWGWDIGPSRELVGSDEKLELLYFEQNHIYLLRRKIDHYILYVGDRKP